MNPEKFLYKTAFSGQLPHIAGFSLSKKLSFFPEYFEIKLIDLRPFRVDTLFLSFFEFYHGWFTSRDGKSAEELAVDPQVQVLLR